MAKVGYEKYSMGQGLSSKEVDGVGDVPIYFTKKGLFYCNVPEIILKSNPHPSTIHGNTYAEAWSKTKDYIDDYLSKGISSKKVIIYFITAAVPSGNHHVAVNRNIPTFRTIKDHFIEDDGRQPRYKMQFDFRVGYITEANVNSSKKYFSENEILSVSQMHHARPWKFSHGNNGHGYLQYMNWEHIDYTEELNEWFESTKNKFDILINSIVDFFGEKPDHFLKSIIDQKFKQIEFKQ